MPSGRFIFVVLPLFTFNFFSVNCCKFNINSEDPDQTTPLHFLFMYRTVYFYYIGTIVIIF